MWYIVAIAALLELRRRFCEPSRRNRRPVVINPIGQYRLGLAARRQRRYPTGFL
jgi:hypothetical protein